MYATICLKALKVYLEKNEIQSPAETSAEAPEEAPPEQLPEGSTP